MTDGYGINYKYPERKCSQCIKYPCFKGIEKCRSEFAAYGCLDYNDNPS